MIIHFKTLDRIFLGNKNFPDWLVENLRRFSLRMIGFGILAGIWAPNFGSKAYKNEFRLENKYLKRPFLVWIENFGGSAFNWMKRNFVRLERESMVFGKDRFDN